MHCGNELWFLSFTLHKKRICLEEKMEITKCLFITLPWWFFFSCFKLLHLQVISKLVSQKMSSHLSWKRKEMKAFLSREPRNNRLNKYSPSHEGAGKGGNWLHKAVFLHLVLFQVKFWLRGALLPSTYEKN